MIPLGWRDVSHLPTEAHFELQGEHREHDQASSWSVTGFDDLCSPTTWLEN